MVRQIMVGVHFGLAIRGLAISTPVHCRSAHGHPCGQQLRSGGTAREKPALMGGAISLRKGCERKGVAAQSGGKMCLGIGADGRSCGASRGIGLRCSTSSREAGGDACGTCSNSEQHRLHWPHPTIVRYFDHSSSSLGRCVCAWEVHELHGRNLGDTLH
jgi:hypothetical protein